jgi:hypothetical protein
MVRALDARERMLWIMQQQDEDDEDDDDDDDDSQIAAALACGVELGAVRDLILHMAADSRARLLGPAGRMSHYVSTGLERLIPHDALQKMGHTLR